MKFREQAISFHCAAETLFGVLSIPEQHGLTAVVIIVGGPQYRVGSHRQFVLLARTLAAAGLVVLRFDFRGMGDSTGSAVDFEHCTADIQAALDALQSRCTGIRRVLLYGLCDGASAALLYVGATNDSRVQGLLLLNPWVRSQASLARTHVKHYYLQRLGQREFWNKLLRGRLAANSLPGLIRAVWTTWRPVSRRGGESPRNPSTFQQRMGLALADFSGPVALVLSGNDYTAKEFVDHAASNALWASALRRPNITRLSVDMADHTFSSAVARKAVDALVLDWIDAHGFQGQPVTAA